MLLREELSKLKSSAKPQTRQEICRTLQGIVVLRARQVLASLLCHWPSSCPKLSTSFLGCVDITQYFCLLDLLLRQQDEEDRKKVNLFRHHYCWKLLSYIILEYLAPCAILYIFYLSIALLLEGVHYYYIHVCEEENSLWTFFANIQNVYSWLFNKPIDLQSLLSFLQVEYTVREFFYLIYWLYVADTINGSWTRRAEWGTLPDSDSCPVHERGSRRQETHQGQTSWKGSGETHENSKSEAVASIPVL